MVTIYSLATLDLKTDVEQSFNCLIIQNRQVVQSMGKPTDWALDDDMVDGLFFRDTLTGRRRGHPHLCKQERERPTPVLWRLSRTHAGRGKAIPVRWVLVLEMKVLCLVVLSANSAFHP